MKRARLILTGMAIEIGKKLDKYIYTDHVQDGSVDLKYLRGKTVKGDFLEATFLLESADDFKLRSVLGLDKAD